MTLLDAHVFQGTGHETALVFIQNGRPDQLINRQTFQAEVRRHAAGLAAHGISPKELILIADTQSLASIYTFWGAIWIGAIPTLFPTQTEKIDPLVYQQRMAKLVRISAVSCIVTTPDFAPTLNADPEIDCRVIQIDQLPQVAKPPPSPHNPSANEIAFLQHSSGTTGLQKGVALSHTAVCQQLEEYATSINIAPQDVVVSWLPIYHDMGLIAGFLLPLYQGIPLVLMSPFEWVRSPALLFRAITQYQGTLCWLPNFAYNHCARRIRRRDLEKINLESMRLFINCSEPVRHDSHDLFVEKFGRLGVTHAQLGVSYAMAENTFAVTQTTPNQPIRRDTINGRLLAEKQIAEPVMPDHEHAVTHMSCGQPLQQTAVRVIDSQNRPLPERHIGQLTIQSPYMLNGYYRRSDLQPFDNAGWYQTGDMGYLVDGEIFVIGRQKDIIINAGKNIYPQDIEAILNTVDGVHPGRVVVFGVPDEKEGTELLAALVESDAVDLDKQSEIGRRLRQAVAQQSMVTLNFAQVVPPKWLIKTSSGKIGRAANREKWLQSRAKKENSC